MPEIDRQDVLRRFIWLNRERRNMLAHNDLDGLLSAAIMQSVNDWRVVGFYDFKNMYLVENVEFENVIGIDMDVYLQSGRFLGHHVTHELPSENGLNLNQLREVKVNPFEVDGMDRFTDKYPMSTAAFLAWLYDIEITPEFAALLCAADSLCKNAALYPRNVHSWLDFFDMPKLKELLTEEALREDKVGELLANNEFTKRLLYDRRTSTRENGLISYSYPQLSFDCMTEWYGAFAQVYKMFQITTGTNIKVPDLRKLQQAKVWAYAFTTTNLPWPSIIKELLEDQNHVSHAFTGKKSLSFSTTVPVSRDVRDSLKNLGVRTSW